MSESAKHLNLTSGIFHDVGEEAYHADLLCDRPTLSRSEAVVLVDQSPLHLWAKHPRLHGAEEKDISNAMDFGSGAHALMLGKGPQIVAVDADNWKTKDARAQRDSIREQGKTPLLRHDLEEARVVVSALLQRLTEFGYSADVQNAKSEVVLLWVKNEHCTCRAMADKLLIDEERKRARFFDFKFTESAQPKWLAKHFADMNYYLQESWYIDGLETVRPDLAGRIDFTYFMQETAYPFAMVPVTLNGEFRTCGRSKRERAVALWSKCMETGKWPGYTQDTIDLAPPGWLSAVELAAQSI